MKLKIVFILLLCQQFIIAQLTDDFSDNDFSNNPTWSGDVEKFDVLDEQLHLNDTTNNSPAILFTAASTQGLATWEFSILLDFNPSSSNYAKVYLNASSSDLDGDLNGYYVKVGGESGDVDDFSLYKQTGSASTKIIDGIDGLAAGDSVLAKVRVTRDDLGNWELFVDKDLAGDFQSQGTVLDDEFLDGAFLGVWCKYTSTRSDKFYFDDFLVDPIFEDTDPPELISIVVLGPNELELNFSEELDLNTAQNNANYNVEGFGNPELAILNQENPSQVLLTFENSFQLNVEQTMTVANLQDLAGNILQNASGTFTYEMADYRSVVINEIMADATPVVGLPESEFVELYNRTSGNLDLSGWAFSDLGDIVAIPEGTIIEANSYLILCPSSEIDLWIDYPNKVGISLPNLNNDGDDLSLFDDLGNLIGNVNYSDSWYGDDDKDDGGDTLELLDADYPCQGASSWAASVAPKGGTPGEKNSQDGVPFDDVGPSLISVYLVDGNSLVLTFSESLDEESVTNDGTLSIEPNLNIGATIYNQEVLRVLLEEPLEEGTVYTITVEGVSDCVGNVIGMFNQGKFLLGSLAFEGDVVINEIMANEKPSVGLPESEFVELYNRSNKNFDLSGWSFSDSGDPVSIPKGAILEANSYLILCPSSKTDLWADYPNKVGISMPNLNNDGDDLSLFDNLGNLIDNVNYSDSWYGDDNKDDGGYTLELLDADYPCQGASSWAASVAPKGGTPGEKNSQDEVPFDDVGPSLISAYVVDGNSLVLTFSESLDEESVTNDGTLSIEPNLNIGATIYNQEVLRVLLEEPLEEGRIYTITVGGVSDCVGNVIGMFNQGRFLLGSLAFKGDVVINEIMADANPSVGLPESEFIELYNRTDKNFDLSDWTFDNKIPKGSILEANSYLILCSDKSLWTDYENVLEIDMPTLNNTSDDLSLFDGLGNLIDNVNYSNSWYGDDNKDDGGYTLELLDADYPCQGISSWAASIDPKGGTPGEKNSQEGVPFDDVRPDLIAAHVVDGDSLVLTFSEALDEESVMNIGYLNIEPNLNTAGITIYEQEVLIIPLQDTMQDGVVYTVTVEGVADCRDNNVIGMFNQASFGIGYLAAEGDIIINEILADPISGGADYVELYNMSDKPIDLSNYSIAHVSSSVPDELEDITEITPNGYLFLPDSYVVLSKNVEWVRTYYGGCANLAPTNFISVSSFPDLRQDDDIVILFETGNQEKVLDQVKYFNAWHNQLLDATKSISLERIDPDGPSNDGNNWSSASINNCGGTPSNGNSQFYQGMSLGEDEIQIDPKIFNPDIGGNANFTQINYQFDKSDNVMSVTIYDDNGRLIRRIAESEVVGSSGSYKWDGADDAGEKALMGIYIVFIEVFDLDGNAKTLKETLVVAGNLD